MNKIPCGNGFSYNKLFDVMTNDDHWVEHSIGQQARIILAILLGTAIFAELDDYCYFHYQSSLFTLIG